jgi:hypothetical protein
MQEIVGKWLVIVQKIWYYTRRSHRERLESFAMPQTLQLAWTRLERIQHLAVYGECLRKTACRRWQLSSHSCALLAWLRWVTCK